MLSTLAGWASELVLGGKRGGGYLRDHEAGVEPADSTRKGGRPLSRVSVEEGDAALGERADLGQHERHDVGADRHRLGVEIAARKDVAVVGEDERIVGHGVRLAL